MNRSVFLLLDKKSPVFTPALQTLTELAFSEVQDAKTGGDALLLLRTFEPALVILDWDAQPIERVTDFLQKFRKLPGKRSVPIVALAGEFTASIIAVSSEYNVTKLMLKSTLKTSFKSGVQTLLQEFSQSTPIKAMLQKLEVAIEKNVIPELDKVVEEFFKTFPEHPRAQLEYGNMALRHGRADDARRIAEKALAGAPNNLRAMNLMSRALMHLGKREQALTILNEAELVSPRNVDRLVLLGDCFFQMGDNSKAKMKYESALAVDGDSRGAKKGLGVIELNDGDVNKALDLFRDSASEEELAGFFNNAAISVVRAGNIEKGVQLYAAAKNPIQTPELLAKVCFNMGLAYRRWHKPNNAKLCFEEALQLDPGHEKAKIQLDEISKGTNESDFIRTPLFDMVDNVAPAKLPEPPPAAAKPEAPVRSQVTVKDSSVVSPFAVTVIQNQTSSAKPARRPSAPPPARATQTDSKPKSAGTSAPAKPTPKPNAPAKNAKPASGKPGVPKFFDDDDEI